MYMKYKTMLCILSVYLRYTLSINFMYTFYSSNLERLKLYKKCASSKQYIIKVLYTLILLAEYSAVSMLNYSMSAHWI